MIVECEGYADVWRHGPSWSRLFDLHGGLHVCFPMTGSLALLAGLYRHLPDVMASRGRPGRGRAVVEHEAVRRLFGACEINSLVAKGPADMVRAHQPLVPHHRPDWPDVWEHLRATMAPVIIVDETALLAGGAPHPCGGWSCGDTPTTRWLLRQLLEAHEARGAKVLVYRHGDSPTLGQRPVTAAYLAEVEALTLQHLSG